MIPSDDVAARHLVLCLHSTYRTFLCSLHAHGTTFVFTYPNPLCRVIFTWSTSSCLNELQSHTRTYTHNHITNSFSAHNTTLACLIGTTVRSNPLRHSNHHRTYITDRNPTLPSVRWPTTYLLLRLIVTASFICRLFLSSSLIPRDNSSYNTNVNKINNAYPTTPKIAVAIATNDTLLTKIASLSTHDATYPTVFLRLNTFPHAATTTNSSITPKTTTNAAYINSFDSISFPTAQQTHQKPSHTNIPSGNNLRSIYLCVPVRLNHGLTCTAFYHQQHIHLFSYHTHSH